MTGTSSWSREEERDGEPCRAGEGLRRERDKWSDPHVFHALEGGLGRPTRQEPSQPAAQTPRRQLWPPNTWDPSGEAETQIAGPNPPRMGREHSGKHRDDQPLAPRLFLILRGKQGPFRKSSVLFPASEEEE